MNKVLLPKTAWYLMILIPLTFVGFYPSYFAKLLTPLPAIFHIHTFFMVAWIGLGLTQPILIHQNKIEMHRRLGKISFVLMPLVVLTIYMMIRHSYYEELERLGSNAIREKYNLSQDDVHLYAAAHEIKAIIALIWLMIFYLLGIVYRKKVLYHATYMLAAILVLLGPALDRIIFRTLAQFHLPSAGPGEYATFSLIGVLFISLLIYQKRNGYSLTPVIMVLLLHGLGIGTYTYLQGTIAWQRFVETLM
jgi:hypothetical protein